MCWRLGWGVVSARCFRDWFGELLDVLRLLEFPHAATVIAHATANPATRRRPIVSVSGYTLTVR
jgi:hypothetical protein